MPSAPCLLFPPFHLDLTTEALWCGSQRLPLRPKAWALLRYLVEHPHRLIPQAELLDAIWQRAYVSDGLLRGSIRELRRVLQDEATTPRFIETVSGRGYRFIAAVSAMPPPLPVPEVPPQPLHSAPLAPAAPQSALTAAVLAEEYKLVTILCGALAEAPTLATRLGPERWYRLLQTVVGLTQEVLQHYAGTLTLATSDGFTAVFGAPVAQEDHARRAVLAALELRQRLQDAPALDAQLTGGVLTLGMGLHAGLVVVGGLGQAPQQLATVVGAPLHIATRLQQQAASGTILLSAATYHLVHAEIRATRCGTLDWDGQPAPMAVYAVQGLLRRQAGVVGRSPRLGSPFVGRERELALLHECLAAASAGHGQVVGLVGEPGMGKTRLLREFCQQLAGRAVTIAVGQCLSYGQTSPYLPIRELLRQVCGIREEDADATHPAAVQHRMHASGLTAEVDIALLLQLLDLPVAPECLAPLSPQARQARTFALLRHVLLHAAQPQPLVLAVENLHWSDPTSAAWLASLVERVADTAVLLVGTYRPGYQPPWGTHSTAMQVALAPLHARESRAVVQAVLGAMPLSEARLRALLTRAGGNPFFLEELAWHTVEQGRSDTPAVVPDMVHTVLAARMDRLPPAAKRLLQVAAVIGMDVSCPLLQTLAEQLEEGLQENLAHLQAAEFLYETRLFPEPAYTFKHALTHEVAYGSLLQECRRALHAQIVAALEALACDRGAEQVERLAHHALRGEVWDKALDYSRQAGARALVRSANQEAVTYFEGALAAFQHLPDSPARRVQAIDLRFDLHMALQPLGAFARMFEILQEAIVLAEAEHDQQRLGRIYHALISQFLIMGDPARAIEAGQRALALATRLDDVLLQVHTRFTLARVYGNCGDHRQAADICRDIVTTITDASLPQRFDALGLLASMARGYAAWCLTELGAFAEGLVYGNEAIQIAQAAHPVFSLTLALWRTGYLYLLRGDLPHAIPLLAQSLDVCETNQVYVFLPRVMAYLGYAYALAGRLSEALPLLEQAQALLEQDQDAERGSFVTKARIVALLSEAYLLAGRLDEARLSAERALNLARTRQERGSEAWTLRLLGDLAAQEPTVQGAAAATYYQQALALVEELGMRPLQAHCHRGLGTLYAATDQREQARTELSAAVDLYQAMEMTFWLPETEAALAQVEGR